MPSGQLMTMPILIVNMGGEMVYILEQRLQAQQIQESKGQKVLNDVVRTMYYPRFIEELFKPQEMYSAQSTRQIFDRLAHSSIMRLNESSMDKLFDLMAMGFKYQVVSCTTPREMLDVTQNHLDTLKRLCSSNQQLLELLDECVRQMHAAYGTMSEVDFTLMRQSLCAFFQDRRVKVSLFLHDHTQNTDGSLVVASSGTLPAGQLPPGTVRYFQQDGQEVRREQCPVVSAQAWAPATGVRTHLGSNVYEKDRGANPEAAPAAGAPPVPAPPSSEPPVPAHADTAKTAAAVGELNVLASLIGTQPVANTDSFKLENLFGENVFSREAKPKGAEVIQIDGAAQGDYHRALNAVGQGFDALGCHPGAGPDDLLDLMDTAGQ